MVKMNKTIETVKSLRSFLKRKNIKGISKLRKNELVQLKNLAQKKRTELYNLAQRKALKGRSKLKKAGLLKSLTSLTLDSFKRARRRPAPPAPPAPLDGALGDEDFNEEVEEEVSEISDEFLEIDGEDIYKLRFDLDKQQYPFTGQVNFALTFDEYSSSEGVFIRVRYKDFPPINYNNASKEQIYNDIQNTIDAYFDEFGEGVGKNRDMFRPTDTEIIFRVQQPANIDNMPVKKIMFNKIPFNISSNKDTINNKSCVLHYLQKYYGNTKRFKKIIKNISDKIEWNLGELIQFLEHSKISYYCYLQNLKCYKFNRFSNKQKTFIFIASNEHIYPVTKKEVKSLKKFTSDDIKNIKYVEDINKFVEKELLINPITKFRVKTHDKCELKFERVLIGNTLYVTDKNLEDSYKLFTELFGMFPISFNYRIYDAFFYIANKNDLFSTYDNNINRARPVYYNNPNVKGDLMAIDKNKAYSYSLFKLDYIPIFNSKTLVEQYNKNHTFDKYNFYYISKTLKNTRGFIKAGWVSGYRLIHMFNDVEITYIKKPILKKNPFKELIKKMMDKNPNLSKFIINCFIGVCQILKPSSFTVYKDLTINKDESLYLGDGFNADIEGKFYFNQKVIDPKNKFNINMLPLSIYVIDNAVNILLEKIIKLKSRNIELVIRTIKTDSITFSANNMRKFYEECTDKDFKKWKIEPVKINNKKSLGKIEEIKDYDSPEILNNIDAKKTDWEELIKNNVLFDCYAGSGKTFLCLKNIIPLIKDEKYIIIGAQHKPLSEYYDLGLNANVIHFYTYNQLKKYEFRKYKYIIVDECGLLAPSHLDYIYQNMGTDTKLLFFGDKKQFKPYGYDGVPLLYNLCILKMFDIIVKLKTNYRNHYTIQNYDDMIKLKYKLTDYENKLFNRYGKINISITRKTRDKINNHYTKDWIQKFGDLKVKKGGRLLTQFTKLNKYNELLKLGLYNCMFLTIVDFNEKTIILKTDNNKIIEVPENLFKDNFNYGYCLTAFRAQGMTIKYDDLGLWDKKYIINNGTALYVVLSRIQNDRARSLLDSKEKPKVKKPKVKKSKVKKSNMCLSFI